MTNKNTKHESSILSKVAAVTGAVVAGAAVGAAAVAMSDPKNRKALAKKLGEVKDMAQDTAADLMEHGQKAVDHVSGVAENIKDRVSSDLEDAKKDLTKRLNDK